MRLKFSTINIYIIAILLVLDNSCMWFLTSSIFGISSIIYYLLAFFCVLGYIKHGRIHFQQSSMFFLGIIILYLCFYLIVTGENPVRYLTKHVLLFTLLYLYCSVLITEGRMYELAKAFVNVVSVIALVSVFFWLFGSVLGVIEGTQDIYYWANADLSTKSYFGLYYENIIQAVQISGKTFIRNTGIYPEAPGFSGYLLIALAIVLPAKKGDFPRVQIILLLLAMLSTLSTKGLLAIIILTVLTYMFRNESKNRRMLVVKMVALVVLLIFAVLGGWMIIEDKSTTSSFIVRMDDMYSGFKAWLSHPIFGAGYNEIMGIVKQFSLRRANNGLSMGLTVLLAQGGIYMFMFYLFSFLSALIVADRTDKTLARRILIFGSLFVYNLFISNAIYTPCTIAILASGYAFAISVRQPEIDAKAALQVHKFNAKEWKRE